MTVTWERQGSDFIIRLEGELDHHAARQVLNEAGQVLEEQVPLRCVLDLEHLGFMDSSGIAVILGLHRRVYSYGGLLTVRNVPKQPARVFKAARIEELVAFEQEGRKSTYA